MSGRGRLLSGRLRLTCIGHSGFAVEVDGLTLVFDYYVDPGEVAEAVLSRSQRCYVFVSHSHRDHLCADILDWHQRYAVSRYVMANECRRKLSRAHDLSQLPVTWLHHDEQWSDGVITVHVFDSTDAGVCFLVELAGWRIFHAGDYTCWHFSEERDAASVRKAQGDFHAILRRIVARAPHIHLAMMPVVPNIGGDWAYGAREFLRAVRVDTFVPMHTWGRDREATQWALYRNPDHGACLHLLAGADVVLGLSDPETDDAAHLVDGLPRAGSSGLCALPGDAVEQGGI